ncbi:concanavalin A-like lectin/glucanase domain-containing protein [Dipodascopsis uninucleata]
MAQEFFLPDYLACTCYADCIANSLNHGHLNTSSTDTFGHSATSRDRNVQSSEGTKIVHLPAPHAVFSLSGTSTSSSGDLIHESDGGDSTFKTSHNSIPLLPSCWSPEDVSQYMELTGDMLEVRFAGNNAKTADQEAAAVRANNPIPPQCGLFYFEIEILSRGKDGFIGIGFCGPKVALNKMPGWVQDSWGYHGDDGNSFACQNSGKPYGPQFSTGDIIGCGINFRNGTSFFTKNGISLGIAFKDLKGTLYPALGMRTVGEQIRANFGQRPFVFDIESYMREEKAKTYKQVNAFPPPLDLLGTADGTNGDTAIASVINKLISSYLAHNGYVDSVRAFSEDIKCESNAFESAKMTEGSDTNDGDTVSEDQEAVNRQHIRAAVLEGNIDRALKLTDLFYPSVLKENQDILFQLRCRKFVEMMRTLAISMSEPSDDSMAIDDFNLSESNDKVTNDQNEDEVMDDVDAPDKEKQAEVNKLLSDALAFGQKLHSSYSSNSLPEVQKSLNDIFALMAYKNPMESPMAYLLSEEGRVAVAEELNSAILVSLGKSSVAPLERLIQHTTILMRELAEQGGQSAFVNVRHDFLSP